MQIDPKPRLHKEFAWAEGVGYLSTSPPDENLFTVSERLGWLYNRIPERQIETSVVLVEARSGDKLSF